MDYEDKEKNNQKGANEKLYPHQLPLNTLFTWFIGILNGKAWEYLGLMMNPETKEVNQDLEKAKITIDSIDFLFKKIQKEMTEEDRKQMDNLIANLKMNYVEKGKAEPQNQKEETKKKTDEKK